MALRLVAIELTRIRYVLHILDLVNLDFGGNPFHDLLQLEVFGFLDMNKVIKICFE
jgi:hypothetical protein